MKQLLHKVISSEGLIFKLVPFKLIPFKSIIFRRIASTILTASLTLSIAPVIASNAESLTSKISQKKQIQKVDEIIKHYTDPNWFSGNVAIFQGNRLIYDKSFGYADIENKIKNTSTTRIRIGSINKHFTATLILQKVQSGQLSLDDKLAIFELGFPKNVSDKITVGHLLRHTSGFADIFNDEYFKTYQTLKTIDDKLPLLIDKPLLFEPGTKRQYSNYGYIVLGAILEKIEGKPFRHIINDNILSMIKAKNTIYDFTENVAHKARSYHFTPMGLKIDKTARLENLTPDGGMYSTAHDLALFYSKLFYSDTLLNDKSKAIMGNGYQIAARKWSEILVSEKAQWRAYGGGPGVSAAAEILIKDKLTVIALANTDGLVAEYITQRITDVFKGKDYEAVRLPLPLFAKNLLAKKGSQFFIDNAKAELAKAGYVDFSARPLNKLGFALLENGMSEQALSVFKANSAIFPNEPNTFDSLGYAYEQLGDKSNALANYQKALALDPQFESAQIAVIRLNQ